MKTTAQVLPRQSTADRCHFVTPTQPVQLNSAETKIVTVVFVTLVLKEMVLFMQIARHVWILMSAKTICTIVFMHSAITPLALMNVRVS